MGQRGNWNNLSLDLGNLILLQLAENGKTKAREYNEKMATVTEAATHRRQDCRIIPIFKRGDKAGYIGCLRDGRSDAKKTEAIQNAKPKIWYFRCIHASLRYS